MNTVYPVASELDTEIHIVPVNVGMIVSLSPDMLVTTAHGSFAEVSVVPAAAEHVEFV